MSAQLSPATIKLAATAQLFATVEFSHSALRLPLQPFARLVTWNPIGVFGYAVRILVLDASGDVVQEWPAKMDGVWVAAWDALTVDFGGLPAAA